MDNNHATDEISVRKFHPSDRAHIRDISYQTSFLENPQDFIDQKEVIADILTLYFTDYESDSSFVAIYHGRVVGYLIGAKDGRQVNQTFLTRMALPMLGRAILEGVFVNGKSLRLIGNFLKSCLKGEFSSPNIFQPYPAILHINIDKDFRGKGVGRRLMQEYFQCLKEGQIKGLQATTMSEQGRAFFQSMGFRILYTGQRSYMRYRLNKNVPVYVLGKAL